MKQRKSTEKGALFLFEFPVDSKIVIGILDPLDQAAKPFFNGHDLGLLSSFW